MFGYHQPHTHSPAPRLRQPPQLPNLPRHRPPHIHSLWWQRSLASVGQSFGMGLFFWLSGRMSAQMLRRWSSAQFIGRKMLRLGLPTAVYTLLINPLTLAWTLPKWSRKVVGTSILAYWKGIRSVRGIVWYTALLLVFDCAAALANALIRFRQIKLRDSQDQRRWDVNLYKALSNWGWVAVAAISFFIRLWYPVGTEVNPLNVQPAYLPQYVFAYSIGYLSVRQNADRFTGPFDHASIPGTSDITEEEGQQWTESVPSSAVPIRLALAISVLTATVCIIPELYARWSGHSYDSSDPGKGGWNLSALIYAFWNEFSFVLIGPALMAYFQRWYNQPATSWLWQARYSYAAYLIHPPLSVAVEELVDKYLCAGGNGICALDMRWWRIIGSVIFTTVIGLVSSAASFTFGRFLVTYVPGLRYII